ncbi:MAG TPA: hypothetical protein VNT79_02215 [Phycisphaerae bacterium]|nr:hypothetical protein [Phycisphaerae bacterium]
MNSIGAWVDSDPASLTRQLDANDFSGPDPFAERFVLNEDEFGFGTFSFIQRIESAVKIILENIESDLQAAELPDDPESVGVHPFARARALSLLEHLFRGLSTLPEDLELAAVGEDDGGVNIVVHRRGAGKRLSFIVPSQGVDAVEVRKVDVRAGVVSEPLTNFDNLSVLTTWLNS